MVAMELNWNKLVDKIITYCFIEWNNNMSRNIFQQFDNFLGRK